MTDAVALAEIKAKRGMVQVFSIKSCGEDAPASKVGKMYLMQLPDFAGRYNIEELLYARNAEQMQGIAQQHSTKAIFHRVCIAKPIRTYIK
jgi:hypothetical protein